MIQAVRQECKSLIEKVHAINQAHILRWWDQLSESSRENLYNQIRSIDFEQVQYFQELLQKPSTIKTLVQMEPAENIPLPKDESS
jgi:UDP-N-acetylglucosamine pyrophosphorylase